MHKDCTNVNVNINQTGHSLGGLLSELVVASGKHPDIFTVVFDSPGAKNMIAGLVNDKLLPYRSSFAPKNMFYDFARPNAINTCNEQWPDVKMNDARNFSFEDFTLTNLAAGVGVIGLPGPTYYIRYFTLNQHKMEHFYRFWHSKESKKNLYSGEFDGDSQWPVGFYAGLKHYYNYNSSNMQGYWREVIDYIWNNNSGIRLIYKNNYTTYKEDYYRKLDAFAISALEESMKYDKSSLTYPLELGDKRSSFDKKSYNNLSNVIMNSSTGHTEQLTRYYNASDINRKLYLAVLVNDISLATKLIENSHANVNSVHGEKKYTLLQIAIILGHPDMMKLLLANHADPNRVNSDGETSMHTLGHERYTDIGEYAKYLIKTGAKIGVKNKSGSTPEQIIKIKCKGCLTSFE